MTTDTQVKDIPQAPADLLAKRDGLIAELDKAAKSASGPTQQAIQKMSALLGSTRQGAAPSGAVHQEVKDAFNKLVEESSKDPKHASAAPPILNQSVEWMQAYLKARGF